MEEIPQGPALREQQAMTAKRESPGCDPTQTDTKWSPLNTPHTQTQQAVFISVWVCVTIILRGPQFEREWGGHRGWKRKGNNSQEQLLLMPVGMISFKTVLTKKAKSEDSDALRKQLPKKLIS